MSVAADVRSVQFLNESVAGKSLLSSIGRWWETAAAIRSIRVVKLCHSYLNFNLSSTNPRLRCVFDSECILRPASGARHSEDWAAAGVYFCDQCLLTVMPSFFVDTSRPFLPFLPQVAFG